MLVEGRDLLGVLEELFVDDAAPARAQDDQRAVLIHLGAVGVAGVVVELDRDARRPWRAVDEDRAQLAAQACCVEAVQEGLR